MVAASGTSVLGDQSLLAAVTPAQVGRFSVQFAQAQTVAPYKVGKILLVRYSTTVANRAYVVWRQDIYTPGVDFDPGDVGMLNSNDRLRVWAYWFLPGLPWGIESDA